MVRAFAQCKRSANHLCPTVPLACQHPLPSTPSGAGDRASTPCPALLELGTSQYPGSGQELLSLAVLSRCRLSLSPCRATPSTTLILDPLSRHTHLGCFVMQNLTDAGQGSGLCASSAAGELRTPCPWQAAWHWGCCLCHGTGLAGSLGQGSSLPPA